jgi:hypothetical protein
MIFFEKNEIPKGPKRGSTSKSTNKKPKAPFAGLHHFFFFSFLFSKILVHLPLFCITDIRGQRQR